ncbi:MAG: hypothetical protein ACYDH1_06395 [Anaerolineaceae bacterium]
MNSHRSDLFMLKTARAIAALNQRSETPHYGLVMAAEFVLPHLLRTHRFRYSSETPPGENKVDIHEKEQVLPKALYSQDELFTMMREGTIPLKGFLDTGFR